MSGYLLVRLGDRHMGVPLTGAEELVQPSRVVAVPGAHEAVRGLIPVRGRMVSLVHLRSLLLGGDPPPTVAEVAVVVTLDNGRVALEVDEVVDLVRDAAPSLPPGWRIPWASSVGRRGEQLVPVVDLTVLGERLRPLEVGERT